MELNVTLSEDQIAYVRDQLSIGRFDSPSAVVSEALRLMESSEREGVLRLREAWTAGKASGRHGPIDFEALRVEARKRLAVAQISRAD